MYGLMAAYQKYTYKATDDPYDGWYAFAKFVDKNLPRTLRHAILWTQFDVQDPNPISEFDEYFKTTIADISTTYHPFVAFLTDVFCSLNNLPTLDSMARGGHSKAKKFYETINITPCFKVSKRKALNAGIVAYFAIYIPIRMNNTTSIYPVLDEFSFGVLKKTFAGKIKGMTMRGRQNMNLSTLLHRIVNCEMME
jgi:hypothetical protein